MSQGGLKIINEMWIEENFCFQRGMWNGVGVSNVPNFFVGFLGSFSVENLWKFIQKYAKQYSTAPKYVLKFHRKSALNQSSMYQMTWHFLCIYFVFHSLHNGQTFLEVKRGLASMEAIWPWLNKNQIKFTKKLLILDHLVRVEFAYFAPFLVII